MPDADDFDVEELRRMLRGETGGEDRPKAAKTDARPAAGKKKAAPPGKATPGKTKAAPARRSRKTKGR